MNWHRLTIMRILYGARNPIRGCEIMLRSKHRVPRGSLYTELTRLCDAGFVAWDGVAYRLTVVGSRVFRNFLKENHLTLTK